MDAEPVIFQHRGRDLFRRSDQARGIARRAGRTRDPHPQPFVMHIAARGVAEQAFGGMIGRLRRSPGLALDISQQLVRLVPGCTLGVCDDRAQRHVEADPAAEHGRAPPEILHPLARLGERFAEDRKHVAMPGTHFQCAFRRTAEEQRWIRLLIRLDIGERAFDPVERAMVVERAVAGPDFPHHVEIFAGSAVAVVLRQEVAFAGLILVAGACDDMQRHPALCELVEGRDLPRRERGRDRARPVRDQELDPLGVVGRVKRDGKTFGRRRVIADEDGIVIPLLVQTGKIAHPLARYLALDQMDRNAFLLGADHTDDSGWHGCFPGSHCLDR